VVRKPTAPQEVVRQVESLVGQHTFASRG
jgi:hypothetical protein